MKKDQAPRLVGGACLFAVLTLATIRYRSSNIPYLTTYLIGVQHEKPGSGPQGASHSGTALSAWDFSHGAGPCGPSAA